MTTVGDGLAEDALIGALLILGRKGKTQKIDDVSEKLEASAFKNRSNATIFRAVSQLRDDKTKIDEITIAEYLEKTDELKAAGGASKIAERINSTPASDNADHYADLVLEAEKNREKNKIGEKLSSEDFGPEEAIEKLKKLKNGTNEQWPTPNLPDDPDPAEDFPLGILPDPARQYVEEKAESLGTEETLVAPFVFGTMGTAIGASCEAGIKSEWSVGTNTYLLLVTPSGVGKSPALKGATRPIIEHHRGLRERYETNLDRYKQARDSEDEREPVEPPKPKAFVNDATIEALARDLENSPRGLVQVMDEASAWTRSMNKYREGDDREFFLRSWNRDSIETSRKTENEVSVESPHLSVLGAMVPSSLQHLTPPGENEQDGFLPRILFVYPDVSQTGMTFAEVTEDTKRSYRQFIGNLYGLEPREKPVYDVYEGMVGDWDPNRVSLSTEARNHIQTWYNEEMVPLKADTNDPIIRSFISKLQDHVFRFSLILQISHSPDSEIIEPVNAKRAINLAEFFLDHFERTIAQISLEAEDGNRDLKRYVLDRILDKLELLESHSTPSPIDYKEIQQATKDKSDIQDAKHLHKLLFQLQDDYCLRINGNPGRGGEKCTVELNPELLKDPPESDSSYSSSPSNKEAELW